MASLRSIAQGAALLASLTGVAEAFWRLPCPNVSGYGRIDPIVDTGKAGAHAHAIHGGNNFGYDTTSSTLLDSSCTSCLVTQDKSAYWTPTLHFMKPDGTTVMVPQVGGMLAYYLLYGDDIQAFPPGFVMLAGDKSRRNFTCAVPEPPKSDWTGYELTQPALEQKALGFNCLNYLNPAATEGTLARHFLPSKDFLDAHCPSGLRLEMMFPSCWNGKDTDSPNHKSHMAYPNQVITGDCPAGFDTRVPSLLYETIWATNAFIGQEGQFVLSNGDPTGYGYHADFMEAWEEGFLQQAVDTCTNPSGRVEDCPLFTLQETAPGLTDLSASQCKFDMPSDIANDNVQGPRQGLPGNNPIQYGPMAATAPGGAPAAAPTAASSSQVPSSSNAPSSAAAPSSSKPPSSAAAPSSSPSSTPSPSKAVVPSIQPSLGLQPVVDKHGGGIVAAAAISSASGSSVVPQSLQVVTAAPSPSSAPSGDDFVGTTMMTSGLDAWEVVIEEETITVTMPGPAPTPTPSSVNRRHLDSHKHAHHGHHH